MTIKSLDQTIKLRMLELSVSSESIKEKEEKLLSQIELIQEKMKKDFSPFVSLIKELDNSLYPNGFIRIQGEKSNYIIYLHDPSSIDYNKKNGDFVLSNCKIAFMSKAQLTSDRKCLPVYFDKDFRLKDPIGHHDLNAVPNFKLQPFVLNHQKDNIGIYLDFIQNYELILSDIEKYFSEIGLKEISKNKNNDVFLNETLSKIDQFLK